MLIRNGRTGRSNPCYKCLDGCVRECGRGPCGSVCNCHGNCLQESLEELRRIAEDAIEKELKKSIPADQHHPFPPHFFEPYIPIKPHRWYWFMYDSSTILRNIIIVCDRVSAYVQKHEPKIDKDLIVEKWREKAQHKAIRDSSLEWGYVAAHCKPISTPRELTHAVFSSGILNTCASVTSSRCTSISTLVLHSATQSSRIQLMAKSPTSEMKANFDACSFHVRLKHLRTTVTFFTFHLLYCLRKALKHSQCRNFRSQSPNASASSIRVIARPLTEQHDSHSRRWHMAASA